MLETIQFLLEQKWVVCILGIIGIAYIIKTRPTIYPRIVYFFLEGLFCACSVIAFIDLVINEIDLYLFGIIVLITTLFLWIRDWIFKDG